MKKIVLAYSGGLDTSIILKWLQINYKAEVIAYTSNIGQDINKKKIIQNAKRLGVKKIIIEDLKNILPTEITLSQLSLRWILMHDAVSVVIPGAKNKDHVNLNTSSSNINEISSLMDKISNIYTEYFFDDVHHRW